MPLVSSDEFLVEWLEIDVAGLRCFGFASSLGTFGPPAREHATLCLTQFEHGASSLHCECESGQHHPLLPRWKRSHLYGGVQRTLTCLLLHCAQPFLDFLWPTRGALLTLLSFMVNQIGAIANIVEPCEDKLTYEIVSQQPATQQWKGNSSKHHNSKTP